jgi:putative modified peptide
MAKAKAAPLDPKVADKLLDLLSTDNEFRRLFKKDPQTALVKAGHKASKDPAALAVLAACCRLDRIAPKADVIRARTKLREMLLAGLSQNPVQLDAASKDSLRTRK